MSGAPIDKLPVNPGVSSRVHRLWRLGSKYLLVSAEMERHGTKPLPSLDLMKRDPVIYPLQRGRFWNENNSTAKANQPTPILKNQTSIRIVSASQLFENRCSDHTWA
jgi:hypothetical protein